MGILWTEFMLNNWGKKSCPRKSQTKPYCTAWLFWQKKKQRIQSTHQNYFDVGISDISIGVEIDVGNLIFSNTRQICSSCRGSCNLLKVWIMLCNYSHQVKESVAFNNGTRIVFNNGTRILVRLETVTGNEKFKNSQKLPMQLAERQPILFMD